jgi:hypothetical protein
MLTTLTTLKARLGIDTFDVKDDAVLTSFIQLVSARFENECNRKFGYAQNTVDEFQGDEMELRVSRFPIDETQLISFSRLTKASEGWQAVTDAEYVLRHGCVVSLLSEIGREQEQLRVQYSGGYVLPGNTVGAGQVALPDDLQQSCVEQCAWLFQNKDRLGMVVIAQEGGRIQQFGELDLLPSVKAALGRYERWMC